MADTPPDKDELAAYAHLRLFESDFDRAQGQLRAVSSAWSAAVLAATALITIHAAEGDSDQRSQLLYVVQLVLLFGSFGVFAFWYVDQRVYQRLLHSVFAYGLHREFRDRLETRTRAALRREL
ncbi:hypothetical protein, partial [Rhodovulum sp. PH10]|uniref:hypothetical protein n=1 Tax=Rhodovulum sp. PH10 TaxID=1187851 RepID=UPI000590C3A5